MIGVCINFPKLIILNIEEGVRFHIEGAVWIVVMIVEYFEIDIKDILTIFLLCY